MSKPIAYTVYYKLKCDKYFRAFNTPAKNIGVAYSYFKNKFPEIEPDSISRKGN